MKTTPTILSVCLSLISGNALAQDYSLDFNADWKNAKTGLKSEFQDNAYNVDTGWQAPHVISNVDSSGVGATLQLSHQPDGFNMEDRPSLSPYFPSDHSKAGSILRVWNTTTGPIPNVTLTFDQSVRLFEFGLEGFRHDDAWKVQAYDAAGQLVNPLWRNPDQVSYTTPGDNLGETAINILTTEGALGAEALGAGKYLAEDKSFVVWNKDNVFERGAAVIDYNGAVVKKLVYSMIEVDTVTGNATGDRADQSMYIGSGIVFQTVPEPSSISLLGLGGIALLMRRRR